MKKTIVTVSGLPRTGKDTFVRMLRDKLCANGWATSSVSSITECKRFMVEAYGTIGKPLITGTELNARERSGLAKLKAALDDIMNYTVELPFTTLTMEDADVVLYQVRERHNLDHLTSACKERGANLFTVQMRGGLNGSMDDPRKFGASIEELKLSENHYPFSLTVNNTRLETLPDWVALAAKLIVANLD